MKINIIIHGVYEEKFQTKLLILNLKLRTPLNVFIVLMLKRTPNVPEQILLIEGGHTRNDATRRFCHRTEIFVESPLFDFKQQFENAFCLIWSLTYFFLFVCSKGLYWGLRS
jgi:hypothetical protein